MTKSLLTNTSMLVVKVPDYLELPSQNQKVRAQKNIIRTLVHLLQTKTLDLLYAGWKPATEVSYFDPIADADDTTIIAINVIGSSGKICDFDSCVAKLLKRFKMELVYNSEHILIDNTRCVNGKRQRLIEIYITSRHLPKRPAAQFTFSPAPTLYDRA